MCMGIIAIAYAEDQEGLVRDLAVENMVPSLGRCGIQWWGDVFTMCTGQDMQDWEWSTAGAEQVAEWAEMARSMAHMHEGIAVMSIYLTICEKHRAEIFFD